MKRRRPRVACSGDSRQLPCDPAGTWIPPFCVSPICPFRSISSLRNGHCCELATRWLLQVLQAERRPWPWSAQHSTHQAGSWPASPLVASQRRRQWGCLNRGHPRPASVHTCTQSLPCFFVDPGFLSNLQCEHSSTCQPGGCSPTLAWETQAALGSDMHSAPSATSSTKTKLLYHRTARNYFLFSSWCYNK